MKKIVEVKEGIVSTVVAILFLLALAIGVWVLVHHDPFLQIVAVLFGVGMVGGCYLLAGNLIAPKWALLAIDGDKLVWSVRTKGPSVAMTHNIPLRSVRRLEFVLPKMAFEPNSKDHVFSELYILDVNGSRHQIPMELWPGVHRKKIVAALQAELPEIEVVESIGEVTT